MNYSKSILLINQNVVVIGATYEEHRAPTLFKSFDDTIEVGDLVIVPTSTRHGFTVAKVTGINLDVNFDDDHEMLWIVDTVDKSDYEEILEDEKKAIEAIKSAELRKKRETLAKDLIANSEEINSLKLADMGASDDGDHNKT